MSIKLVKLCIFPSVIGILLNTLAFTSFAADFNDVVTTDKGMVQGFSLSGMHAFRGIPYAQPPVGELRWKAPVPPKKWSQTLIANRFGNTCASSNALGGFGQISLSEDCLYLNVYVPAKNPPAGQNYPVMVWIHGGGLSTGSGNDYNPANLVKHNVIVVTFNYRLGMFGYFSHPAINSEDHPIINYGTLDQQAALQWVHDNIKNFGGDENNVTIFGESAGGHSVMAQLVSPAAKGLFNKAIVSSGAYSFIQPTMAEANQFGEEVANVTGCSHKPVDQVATCLRAAPASLILEKGPDYNFTAQVVVDGTIIPTTFTDAFSSGNFNQVPIINGFNSNEGTFFAALTELNNGRKISAADYKNGLRLFMGEERGNKLLALQESSTLLKDKSENMGENYANFLGLVKFICPVPLVSDMLSKHTPIYIYEFADSRAPALLEPVSFPSLAYHTAELQYIFAGFHGVSGRTGTLDASQQKLSDLMVSYWTHFAKNGTPNGESLPQWTPYNTSSGNVMKLIPNGSEMESNIAAKYHCNEVKEHLIK